MDSYNGPTLTQIYTHTGTKVHAHSQTQIYTHKLQTDTQNRNINFLIPP